MNRNLLLRTCFFFHKENSIYTAEFIAKLQGHVTSRPNQVIGRIRSTSRTLFFEDPHLCLNHHAYRVTIPNSILLNCTSTFQ